MAATMKKQPAPVSPTNDPSLANLPRLEDLPETLPKAGVIAAVHRSKLHPHPKNPREIDSYAESELLESVKRSKGLREPPTWNRRNGLLVGGHQRLRMEDRRRGTQDYWVRVIVVDYDEAQHIEEMVAVNNESLMGMYDAPLLAELIQEPGVDFSRMGFDSVNLEELLVNSGIDLPEFLFPTAVEAAESSGAKEARDAAGDIADQLDEADAAKATEKSKRSRNSPEEIKERRREYQQQAAYEGQTDVAVTLVAPTEELKRAFMRFIDRPENAERVDLCSLVKFLGLDIPEFAELADGDERDGDGDSDDVGDREPAGAPSTDTGHVPVSANAAGEFDDI